MSELYTLSIHEAGELLRQHKISSVELTQAHLASDHPGLEYDRDAILFMAY